MNIFGFCEFCDVWFAREPGGVRSFSCPSCDREPIRIKGYGGRDRRLSSARR